MTTSRPTHSSPAPPAAENTPANPANGKGRVYLEFYQFKESPFSITPDPDFLFLSQTHKSVIDKILYGIDNRMGFILLTGEVGTGKTTLCRAVLDKLNQTARTVYLINPSLSGRELIASILDDLGIGYPEQATKKTLIGRLNESLLATHEKQPTVVIIDEAQTMTLDALEDLRLLSNLETDKKKLVQMVLVGQPELLTTLSNPQIRQLKQRVDIYCRLEFLTRDEIEGYISRRLFIAGDQGHVRFTRQAIGLIYKASQGTPRLINKICDYALTAGYVATSYKIGRQEVQKAIGEVTELDHVAPEHGLAWFERLVPDIFNLKAKTIGLLAATILVAVVALILLGPLYLTDRTSTSRVIDSAEQQQTPAKVRRGKIEMPATRPAQPPTPTLADSQSATPPVQIDSGTQKHETSAVPAEPQDGTAATGSSPSSTPAPPPATTPTPKSIAKTTGATLSYPFILQLGAFNSIESTLEATAIFSRKGIQVHYTPVDLGEKGIWYRVFTGLFKTKAELMAIKTELGLNKALLKRAPWAILAAESKTCEALAPTGSRLRNNRYDALLNALSGRCQLLTGIFVTRQAAEKAVQQLASFGVAGKIVER